MTTVRYLPAGAIARPPIRVLVADHDPLARRVMCDHLASAGISVVGQARDGDEAVQQALALEPDVVVMDLLLSSCDGIAATRQIATQAPGVRIVLLSVSDDEELALLALRAGAVGFVDKDIPMPALARVVTGVESGEAALHRRMTRRLIAEFRVSGAVREQPRPAGTQALGAELSHREQQVLRLLADGQSGPAIADVLGIAPETVRTHVRSILRKLRVHTREEAVAVARERLGERLAGV